MTETGITHVNRDQDCRYKSVGKCMDLVEQKVTLSLVFRKKMFIFAAANMKAQNVYTNAKKLSTKRCFEPAMPAILA